jgi:hypothetical protein
MGAAARTRVPRRYAVERLLDDMDAFYRSLLERKGVSLEAAAGTR